MTSSSPPPDSWIPPDLKLFELADRSPAAPEGFLCLKRRELSVRFPDGTNSQPFLYDEFTRRALDAVVIAAHFQRNGKPWVYLRSALRPPLAFRRCASADPFGTGVTWELPAGLIEPEETGARGVLLAAARELEEELGFRARPEEFLALGGPVLPCPALIAEQQFFVRVKVNPPDRMAPQLDGSPLEEFGKVIEVSVEDALKQCREGTIGDSKTELGLRRLLEACQGDPS